MEYNFGICEDGKFGWKVKRLIKLAENIPSKILDIETIDLNKEDYQWSKHKNSMNDALWHFEKIYNADLSYPILTIKDPLKIKDFIVIDGWHRIIKAKILGIRYLERKIIKLPDPDYCKL